MSKICFDKKGFDIGLVITICTIIFSIGGSFTVVQLKANQIDEVKKKADTTELKVVAVETKIDDLKEDMKELKMGIKEIIRAVK